LFDDIHPPESQAKGRLFAVPGNIESKNVGSTISSRDVFRQRFSQLESAIDFIIDTSPTPSRLNEDILLASDYVIIPTDCEAFSALEGLPDSIQHVLNAHNALKRIHIDGAKLYGQATEFAELLGKSAQTLWNWASVSKSIETSRRREVLSFGHHDTVVY